MSHTQGFAAPAVARVYARARELCSQVGMTPQLSAVLGGLTSYPYWLALLAEVAGGSGQVEVAGSPRALTRPT